MSKTKKLASLYEREVNFYLRGGMPLARAHMMPAPSYWASPRKARAFLDREVLKHGGLPENLAGYEALRLKGEKPHHAAEKLLRMGGFLRALRENPDEYALAGRLVRSAFTPDRGAGSSYQFCELGQLVEKLRSPGALQSHYRKVRWGMRRLLGPLGLLPPREAVLRAALFGARNPRRAAYQGAAAALVFTLREIWEWEREGDLPSFREAREILASPDRWGSPLAGMARARISLAQATGLRPTWKVAAHPEIGEAARALPQGVRNLVRKGWFRLQRGGEIQEQEKQHTLLALLRAFAAFGRDAQGLLDWAFQVRAEAPAQAVHDAGIGLPASPLTDAQKEWVLVGGWEGLQGRHSVLRAWDSLVRKGWDPRRSGSLAAAEAILASFKYEGAKELALAMEAAKWGVPDWGYPQIEARWLEGRSLSWQAIPAPGGTQGINGEDLRLVQLGKDDPRGLFIGHHTGCCQHPGGVGESCAWHSILSPKGAVWAVETVRTGRIIAQSWAWRREDVLVLDNIEAMGHESHEDEIRGLFREAARWVVARKALGITQVWVGTGMSDIRMDEDVESLPVSKPTGVYSDARKAWRVAG